MRRLDDNVSFNSTSSPSKLGTQTEMRRVDTYNRTEMEKIVDDDDDVEIVGRRNTERQRAEAEPDEEF